MFMFSCEKLQELAKQADNGDNFNSISLASSWSTPCLDGDRFHLEIDSDSMGHMRQEKFEGSECLEQSLKSESIFNVNFLYNETNFSMALQTLEMRLFNSNDIAAFNSSTECGFNDWEAGVLKQVIPTDCLDDPTGGVTEMHYTYELSEDKNTITLTDDDGNVLTYSKE